MLTGSCGRLKKVTGSSCWSRSIRADNHSPSKMGYPWDQDQALGKRSLSKLKEKGYRDRKCLNAGATCAVGEASSVLQAVPLLKLFPDHYHALRGILGCMLLGGTPGKALIGRDTGSFHYEQALRGQF